jgi:hypothetical protein
LQCKRPLETGLHLHGAQLLHGKGQVVDSLSPLASARLPRVSAGSWFVEQQLGHGKPSEGDLRPVPDAGRPGKRMIQSAPRCWSVADQPSATSAEARHRMDHIPSSDRRDALQSGDDDSEDFVILDEDGDLEQGGEYGRRGVIPGGIDADLFPDLRCMKRASAS